MKLGFGRSVVHGFLGWVLLYDDFEGLNFTSYLASSLSASKT
jgi:hypothetical protein